MERLKGQPMPPPASVGYSGHKPIYTPVKTNPDYMRPDNTQARKRAFDQANRDRIANAAFLRAEKAAKRAAAAAKALKRYHPAATIPPTWALEALAPPLKAE